MNEDERLHECHAGQFSRGIRMTVEISREDFQTISEAVDRSHQSLSAVISHAIKLLGATLGE
jgi:hypothetical protein